MVLRATLTFSELESLLDAPSGAGLELSTAAGLPVFQLDAAALKLIGWRSAARLVRERFSSDPEEIERRLSDLDELRGGRSVATRSRPDRAIVKRKRDIVTAQAVIELLQRASCETRGKKRRLTRQAFDRWASATAIEMRSWMIVKLFGTWTEALEAAGLPVPDTQRLRAARAQRKERAIAWVRRAAEDTGESPLSVRTYNAWALTHEAEDGYKLAALFGGFWSELLHAAGLEARENGWRGTDEQIAERLRCAAADLEVGWRLSQPAYRQWLETHDGPGVEQVRDRFGSWAEALAYADVEAVDRKQLPTFLPIDSDPETE